MTYQLLTDSKIVKSQLRTDLPEFKTGTVVEVYYTIKDGDKTRTQLFKGLVISRHGGNGLDATFTVLKNASASIKVHRTFPLHSPLIKKIELISPVQRGRRSKLYFTAKLKDPIKTLRSKIVNPLKPKEVKIEKAAVKETPVETKDVKEVKGTKPAKATKTTKKATVKKSKPATKK